MAVTKHHREKIMNKFGPDFRHIEKRTLKQGESLENSFNTAFLTVRRIEDIQEEIGHIKHELELQLDFIAARLEEIKKDTEDLIQDIANSQIEE